MKFPIMVLSYGDFAGSKKLFFYENEGIPMFPIFTNPEDAEEFRRGMQKILIELGDDRTLVAQVCEQPRHAINMLEIISLLIPGLSTVIFDPSIPGNGGLLIGRNRKKTIEEACQEISEESSP